MDSFGTWRVEETERVTFRAWVGGTGPAILLLHGFPETARAWSAVAALLCPRFTVIAPDLPGYGFSRIRFPGTYDYSKRSMAADILSLLRKLEYFPIHVVGHDRGARVAYRLALDAPEAIRSLTVLGIIPTSDVLGMMDASIAASLYHWFMLAQPEPLPEHLIAGDPDFFVAHTLESWSSTPGAISGLARTEYLERFRDPDVIHAACQDYRAALTLDADADIGDLEAGRRIVCPTLAVRGRFSLGYVKDFSGLWKRWTGSLRTVELDCGHFVMEERPQETSDLISDQVLDSSVFN